MDISGPSAEPSLSPWQGVLGFPFQVNNLKASIIVTLCAIFLAFDASGFAITGDLIRNSIPEGKEFFGPAPTMYMGGMRVYIGLGVLAMVACLAPSAFFVIIIQDTAAGNEDIDWPDEVWYEYLTKIAFLGWIFSCCAAVSTIFWLLVTLLVPIPGVIWWALVLLT